MEAKGKKILIIVGDYSEDYEVMVPFQCLQIVGHEVHICSPGKKSGDKIQTAVHDFKPDEQFYFEMPGHKFQLNFTFDEVKAENYDGLVLPGGRAPEYLRYNPKVIEITKYFIENNKPIAAVCHGGQILAATNMIKGRRMTSFYTVQMEMELVGVEFVKDEEAVADGNIVTGQTYLSHVPWMSKFLELLK